MHCSELATVARFDEVLVEVADANVLRLSELAARTDAAALIRQERLEREAQQEREAQRGRAGRHGGGIARGLRGALHKQRAAQPPRDCPRGAQLSSSSRKPHHARLHFEGAINWRAALPPIFARRESTPETTSFPRRTAQNRHREAASAPGV